MNPPSVLFICTHNSARSQMAEGLLRALRPDARVLSAGTEPGGVNPFAIRAMDQLGIDISKHTSDSIDLFVKDSIDYVITVCDSAREKCPYFPATIQNIHSSFPDPSATVGSDEVKQQSFARIRNEIQSWMQAELIPLMDKTADAVSNN